MQLTNGSEVQLLNHLLQLQLPLPFLVHVLMLVFVRERIPCGCLVGSVCSQKHSKEVCTVGEEKYSKPRWMGWLCVGTINVRGQSTDIAIFSRSF